MRSVGKIPAKAFDQFLSSLAMNEEEIEALGWKTTWSGARPRKITLPKLLTALALESVRGDAGFNDLGSRIHRPVMESGPSRQAVSKRINAPLLEVMETLLATPSAPNWRAGARLPRPPL